MNNTITHNTIGNALIHGLEVGGKSIIQMRDSDGFCNLTYMCKVGGKRTQKYLKNPKTKELIEVLKSEFSRKAVGAASRNSEPSEKSVAPGGATIPGGVENGVVNVIQRGKLAGTWAHPDLAIDCAMWCSVAFGRAVTQLVRKFMMGELTSAESRQAAQLAAEHIRPESSRAAEARTVVTPTPVASTESLMSMTYEEKWQYARKRSLDAIKKRQNRMRDTIPGLTPKDYAQFNNRSNQLIYGFRCTTAKYKRDNGLKPRTSLAEYMSPAQLGGRALFDLIMDEKMEVKKIDNVDTLTRSREETVQEMQNICSTIRRIRQET